MLKSELLELLNDIEDTTDIDDVVGAKYITLDKFKEKLSDKEFKSFIDSEKDKHSQKSITTAIENFKKKDMRKLIDAKVLELTGDNESPEQKAIRELQDKLAGIEKEKMHAEMVAKYKDVFHEKNIPSSLTNFLLAEDEDVVNANISLFEESMKSYIESKVSDRIKDTSYTPPKDNGGSKTYTMEDLAKMTPEEINANWDKISK